MRLVLDAMGGDLAPTAAVEGAYMYARSAPNSPRSIDNQVILVGDEARIGPEIDRLNAWSFLKVHHAPQVVSMSERPGNAVRSKKGSSIRVCFELLKEKKADAVVSAGNSGAVMAAALLVLGGLPEVERPAIASVLPTACKEKLAVLLDCGATVACKPIHLVQFAYLGEAFVRRVLKVERPKVAILSNGTENNKGTDLTRETLAVLQQSPFDFVGYVEGNDLLAGEIDVVVTDGFTGNIALKTMEGVGEALLAILEKEMRAQSESQWRALVQTPAFAQFHKTVDWNEYGGAPLLGVKGEVVVAHGRSTAQAFVNALRFASEAASIYLHATLTEAAIAANTLCKSAGLDNSHSTSVFTGEYQE